MWTQSLFLATAALLQAVSGLPTTLGGVDTTDFVDLSEIYSAAQSRESSLQKRSSFSAGICERYVTFKSPLRGGPWLFASASCVKAGESPAFRVDCFAQTLPSDRVYGIAGSCNANQVCVEFHGYDSAGETTGDIACVSKAATRYWMINSVSNAGKTTGCSSGYVNKSNNNLKLALEVNVLDSLGVNRIAPASVWFQINQKIIGGYKYNDPEVGSGIIDIPPGGSLQACVNGRQGQVLSVFSGITGFF